MRNHVLSRPSSNTANDDRWLWNDRLSALICRGGALFQLFDREQTRAGPMLWYPTPSRPSMADVQRENCSQDVQAKFERLLAACSPIAAGSAALRKEKFTRHAKNKYSKSFAEFRACQSALPSLPREVFGERVLLRCVPQVLSSGTTTHIYVCENTFVSMRWASKPLTGVDTLPQPGFKEPEQLPRRGIGLQLTSVIVVSHGHSPHGFFAADSTHRAHKDISSYGHQTTTHIILLPRTTSGRAHVPHVRMAIGRAGTFKLAREQSHGDTVSNLFATGLWPLRVSDPGARPMITLVDGSWRRQPVFLLNEFS